MRLYYNTNGFPHHRLDDVVDILADQGYDGIGLTPDVHHLDPYHATTGEIDRFAAQLSRRGLAVTIEAGARFVLDPRRKHHPTLLSSEGYERRQEFYCRLIDLAARLGSPLVSIWSGASEEDTPAGEAALARLAERLGPVMEHAMAREVTVAFEPEPGMRLETLTDFRRLRELLAGARLGLTIDTGHLAVSEDPPYAERLLEYGGDLVNVHADDAKRGVHEHLMFGEGDLDFAALGAALGELRYSGPICVELSRHGHAAPAASARAIEVLRSHGF